VDVNNIVSLLQHLGAQKIGPGEKNVQLSCILAPWTHKKGRDSDPSMGIKVAPDDTSLVHCYGCDFSGTLLSLIRELIRLDPDRGVDWIDIEYRVSEMEEVNLTNLVAGLPSYSSANTVKADPLPEVYLEKYANKAHPYILSRGLRIDPTLRTWEVGYDQAARRVILPVRNRDKELIGAVGRSIDQNPDFRYINYWSFKKSTCLYGEHLAQDYKPTIVVEGPINALRVWQALSDAKEVSAYNVVALFGSETSTHQLKILTDISSELILFLDNDSKGYKGRDDLINRFRGIMSIQSVLYPGEEYGSDPDEYILDGCKNRRDPAHILHLIKNAIFSA